MRFYLAPQSLLQLITAILLTPRPTVLANPAPAVSALAGFDFNELFARYDCSGTYCGYSSQLCCTGANTCYTDSSDQAQCGASGSVATSAAAGGYWQYYTSVFVETDTVAATTTQVYSSYIAAASSAAVTYATASASASCNYALNESPCGGICCASGQYCYTSGTCSAAANGGSSGYYSTATTTAASGATAGAGIRGTSSSETTATVTSSPTTTIPFETPVATGANITLTNDGSGDHSGLSGGAIAGIVIGTLLGLLLLALILFYCCLRGLFGAIFGRKKKNRRVTEVEEYERRSHHAHGRGSGGGGGGRTWYGAAKPARTSRYEERNSRRSNTGKEALGIAGGLAALWAVLGLKRQRDNKRRNEEKYSEYSYSSDYYTSASEYNRTSLSL